MANVNTCNNLSKRGTLVETVYSNVFKLKNIKMIMIPSCNSLFDHTEKFFQNRVYVSDKCFSPVFVLLVTNSLYIQFGTPTDYTVPLTLGNNLFM